MLLLLRLKKTDEKSKAQNNSLLLTEFISKVRKIAQ